MFGAELGGFTVLSADWVGVNSIELIFRATERTDRLFQLYAGRRLIGTTSRPAERSIVASIPAGPTASPLRMIVVDPTQRLTDYSHLLAWMPNNLFCVSWQDPATIGDLSHFDICLSTEAGGSYDAANIVGRVDYDPAVSTYHFSLPPIQATGDWEVAVIPRDNALPDGNAGTPSTTTITAVVYPADLALNAAGHRFEVDVAAGELTATFAYEAA